MAHLWQDVRYGIRALGKRPGFTLVAILTLALGIGANTALFTILDAVLLKPLPYVDPDRLLAVWERPPSFPRNSVAVENFLDWRAQNKAFSAMSATTNRSFNLSGIEQPEKVTGLLVSANYFDLLGVRPLRGRTFIEGEDTPGKDHVAIVTNRFWKERFSSDANLVGREITLDGEKYTVVGILADESNFDRGRIQIFVPLAFNPQRINRQSHYLTVYARLKPGTTIEQAQTEMNAIAAGIAERSPETNKGWGVTLDPLRERLIRPDLRRQVLILFSAVALVLLIACANLANLLLARAATRHREISIRAALGATRWRLLQQFLVESMILSLAGGILGVIAGYWMIDLLLAFIPPGTLPAEADVAPDARMLFFTLGLSFATGLLFGLAPAWHASRPNLNEAMKDGKSSPLGGRRRVFSHLLIVAEVALALILLVGAGLLIRSLLRLERAELGFEPTNVLTMHTSLPQTKYRTPEQVQDFYDRAMQEMRRIPGVERVGVAIDLPIVGWSYGVFFGIAGRAPAPASQRPAAHLQIASPDYFRALAIPIKRGRNFNERDDRRAPNVAIINETLARLHFSGQDPIGQKMIGDSGEVREIVGVVGDVRVYGLGDRVPERNPEFYVPFAQSPTSALHFAVRTAGDPLAIAGAAQAAIRSIDRDQPVTGVRAMSQIVNETVSDERFNTMLIGIFAAVASALAAIGLYGIIAYTVAQQTAEIGIRIALGAQKSDVLRLVIGRAMMIVAAGLGLGLVGAVLVTHTMSTLLYGVSVYDPMTFVTTPLILAITGLIAGYLPARRAAKVDPLIALRCE